ncbi:Fc.00g043420.m01.CDS01 [Cosmosporella sp. VM-42]
MSTSSEPKPSSAGQHHAPTVPPNGGARAWRTVAGGWLCQFCSFGFINALGSFQYVYEKDILRTKSASDISWILTVQLFLMFFLSQPVGLAVDMFGTRPILLASLLLSVGGLIGLSFASEYWEIFLAQSLCFGLGAAGAFVPGLVAAGQFFTTKRAFALGIVASGSSCGGVVFPIMLARLFDQIGFRQTLRWTALMIGVMLALANILITTANPPKGLAGRRSLVSLAVFKKPTYLLFAAGSFLFFWGIFGPFNYLPLFADDSSTRSVALYTVSIVNAASMPGRIIPNFFSDRVGNLKCLTIAAATSGVMVLVIWLPINYHKSRAGLIIFCLVFGFTSGAYVSLMTPALIEVAGGHTTDLGVMLGTYFAIISIASLTGLPIQGAIVPTDGDADVQLMGLIVFCGATMLCGSGLLGCSLWMRGRKKGV